MCQLILWRIVKIVATKCQILKLKCTKIDFGWGSVPDHAGGAYSAPPDPLAGLKGAYVKGRGCGKGWEGEEREEKRGERDGNGGHPQYFIAPPFQYSRNMPCTNGYRITCPSKERHYHPFPSLLFVSSSGVNCTDSLRKYFSGCHGWIETQCINVL